MPTYPQPTDVGRTRLRIATSAGLAELPVQQAHVLQLAQQFDISAEQAGKSTETALHSLVTRGLIFKTSWKDPRKILGKWPNLRTS